MRRAPLSLYLLGIAMCAGGCAPRASGAPSAASVHQPSSSIESAEAPVAFAERDWGEVSSARFMLAVSLPERRAWSVDDASQPWLTMRHDASASQLLARTWLAPRLVRPAECEQQARLWRRDLPVPASDELVDRALLAAPNGFQTEVRVGVSRRGAELEGYVLAFGASVSRCYALVFMTSASGPGAEGVLGRRLATVNDGVLPRVRSLGVEDRVRP